MNNDWKLSSQVWSILQDEFGLALPPFHVEPLDAYARLLQEWNPTTKLLSRNDLHDGVDAHVADSWSLLPYCYADLPVKLLDVGAGGGFPGVPLAVAVPHLNVTLLDRSQRKTAFLKRVAVTLRLGNVTVLTGSFPDSVSESRYDYLSARAVERPSALREAFAAAVRDGATFLCQSEDTLPEGPNFQGELIEDIFTSERLRRGRLWVVRRTHQGMGSKGSDS